MPDKIVPLNELDEKLLAVIRAYRMTQRIAQWFLLFVSMIAIISLAVSLTASVNEASTAQNTATSVVRSQCAFYRDLGIVPPPPNVTAFGAKLLVDSRNAYIGLGCAGKLPAPSLALIQDVAKYGLVLKG